MNALMCMLYIYIYVYIYKLRKSRLKKSGEKTGVEENSRFIELIKLVTRTGRPFAYIMCETSVAGKVLSEEFADNNSNNYYYYYYY